MTDVAASETDLIEGVPSMPAAAAEVQEEAEGDNAAQTVPQHEQEQEQQPASPGSKPGTITRVSQKGPGGKATLHGGGLPSQPDAYVLAAGGKAPSKPAEHSSASSQPAAATATGSANALLKARAAASSVSSTISKAKAALAKAREAAAAAEASGGGLASGVSAARLVSSKPWTLYGCVEPPPPKPVPQITPPSKQENAKRRTWQAEKQAVREQRLAQDAARRKREDSAKAAAAAARAEAHRKLLEERKAKFEVTRAREAELLARSEAAWKQSQQERGRPPLFQQMEVDFERRQASQEEAKRAAYEAEVAAAKLATVSQLVSGEVVIRPPAGSISPGRSRSPGSQHSPSGSGDHTSLLAGPGRVSPVPPNAHMRGNRRSVNALVSSSWAGGGMHKWPGGVQPPKQLVDRACSPFVLSAADSATSLPPVPAAGSAAVKAAQPAAVGGGQGSLVGQVLPAQPTSLQQHMPQQQPDKQQQAASEAGSAVRALLPAGGSSSTSEQGCASTAGSGDADADDAGAAGLGEDEDEEPSAEEGSEEGEEDGAEVDDDDDDEELDEEGEEEEEGEGDSEALEEGSGDDKAAGSEEQAEASEEPAEQLDTDGTAADSTVQD